MTQSPIEPPNDPRRRSDRDRAAATGPLRPLALDEMVALLVAFLSLGGVLFWGLTRGEMKLFSDDALTPSPVATAPRVDTSSSSGGDTADAGITSGDASADAAGQVDGAVAANGDDQTSAVSELSAQAAARRERVANRKPIWEDVRDGMAGAAAGVAGVAVTADGADAADEPADTLTADSSTDVADANADAGAAVPEVGTAQPSQAATDAPKEAVSFSDVADDYWAKPYIDGLSSRGLISGYADGSFKPDGQVTRAEIAKIVSNTFELTADTDLAFSDVSEDYWARESIGEVVKGGFMVGFPDDTFDPGTLVTKTQALTTLVTGLGVETPTNIQASLDRYTDANKIPKWANEKMAAATAGSLVVNYPDVAQLSPDEPVTRAELSAMIYQALVRAEAVDPIESTYLVKP